jgi:hypothetical protein
MSDDDFGAVKLCNPLDQGSTGRIWSSANEESSMATAGAPGNDIAKADE